MAGIFSNPANWKIVDSIQGQEKTNYSFNNPLSALGGLTQKTYNLGAKIGDPNYDLIPGIDNPFNNVTAVQGASTSGGNENTYDENQWAPEQNDDYYGTGGSLSGGSYYNGVQSNYNNVVGSLTGQLNRLPGLQNEALGKIDTEFSRAQNRAAEDKALSDRNLALREEQNLSGRVDGLRGANQSARSTYRGIQGRLASAGASNSSSAKIAAPRAVTKELNQNRQSIFDVYNENKRSGDFQKQQNDLLFGRQTEDLRLNREARRKAVIDDFNSVAQEINAKMQMANDEQRQALAQIGEEARAQALSELQSLGAGVQSQLDATAQRYATAPAVSVDTSQYSNIPGLNEYALPVPTAVAQYAQGDAAGVPDYLLPYLPMLRKNARNPYAVRSVTSQGL